jgi:hypothetical protein
VVASTTPSATMPNTTVNPAMKLVETCSSHGWESRRSPSRTALAKISSVECSPAIALLVERR